jgi:hypothetical protein
VEEHAGAQMNTDKPGGGLIGEPMTAASGTVKPWKSGDYAQVWYGDALAERSLSGFLTSA